jgi:prepilin-type N-terminal cleavage/methylation domain-containing protein
MKKINKTKQNYHYSKKNAFTMIELILVIIVIGILALLAIPRLDRDLRQQAADNILSAIRHTQHMALTDNRHRFNRTDWQKSLWQIRFTKNTAGDIWSYTIGSNNDYAPPTNGTSIDKNESVIDPMNGKYIFNQSPSNPLDDESPNIFLTKKYGINTITFNSGCHGTLSSTAMHIAFDNLGRPHRGVTSGATNDYDTYINNSNCQITFSSPSFDSTLTIEIKQETGYAFIVGQNDS